MSAREISDAAVQKATGHDWAEWLKLLDQAGAKKMSHQEIVAVAAQHGAGRWWQQMVTVTYEQKRGLREVHQQSGGFTANVSRTIAAPVADVYDAWSKWIRGQKAKVRTSTVNKSSRITWHDGTNVEAGFYDKGENKSTIAVQHSKLPDAKSVSKQKQFWSDVIATLVPRSSKGSR
jgi:hypothetical protein